MTKPTDFCLEQILSECGLLDKDSPTNEGQATPPAQTRRLSGKLARRLVHVDNTPTPYIARRKITESSSNNNNNNNNDSGSKKSAAQSGSANRRVVPNTPVPKTASTSAVSAAPTRKLKKLLSINGYIDEECLVGDECDAVAESADESARKRMVGEPPLVPTRTYATTQRTQRPPVARQRPTASTQAPAAKSQVSSLFKPKLVSNADEQTDHGSDLSFESLQRQERRRKNRYVVRRSEVFGGHVDCGALGATEPMTDLKDASRAFSSPCAATEAAAASQSSTVVRANTSMESLCCSERIQAEGTKPFPLNSTELATQTTAKDTQLCSTQWLCSQPESDLVPFTSCQSSPVVVSSSRSRPAMRATAAPPHSAEKSTPRAASSWLTRLESSSNETTGATFTRVTKQLEAPSSVDSDNESAERDPSADRRSLGCCARTVNQTEKQSMSPDSDETRSLDASKSGAPLSASDACKQDESMLLSDSAVDLLLFGEMHLKDNNQSAINHNHNSTSRWTSQTEAPSLKHRNRWSECETQRTVASTHRKRTGASPNQLVDRTNRIVHKESVLQLFSTNVSKRVAFRLAHVALNSSQITDIKRTIDASQAGWQTEAAIKAATTQATGVNETVKALWQEALASTTTHLIIDFETIFVPLSPNSTANTSLNNSSSNSSSRLKHGIDEAETLLTLSAKCVMLIAALNRCKLVRVEWVQHSGKKRKWLDEAKYTLEAYCAACLTDNEPSSDFDICLVRLVHHLRASAALGDKPPSQPRGSRVPAQTVLGLFAPFGSILVLDESAADAHRSCLERNDDTNENSFDRAFGGVVASSPRRAATRAPFVGECVSELIQKCGGHLTSRVRCADLVVVAIDKPGSLLRSQLQQLRLAVRRRAIGVPIVSSDWILDSILDVSCADINKYTIATLFEEDRKRE